MIVDDNPANLKLLEDMLMGRGHDVRSFPLGRLALAAAINHPPDLILLDINMPEMNGYEVCRRLKSTTALLDIPVIFLSALNETHDKVKAFKCGAVDYISKPFQFDEVHARVQTHLELHNLQRALRIQNEHLEEAVAARTSELSSANERLSTLDRSKNDFLNLISHEFRTPLNGVLGVAEIILDGMSPTRENNELKVVFDGSRQRLLSILDDALLLTRIDVNSAQFKCIPISLNAVVDRAIVSATAFAESRNVVFENQPARVDRDVVLGCEDLLVSALRALLETAVKFSSSGETVSVSGDITLETRGVIIESVGKSIPIHALSKFFDLFSISEAISPGGDLGVGIALAYRILSLLGGSASVANRDKPGIRLTIWLKAGTRASTEHQSL
jgi:two-component system sensor histidine kinase/response regulator